MRVSRRREEACGEGVDSGRDGVEGGWTGRGRRSSSALIRKCCLVLSRARRHTHTHAHAHTLSGQQANMIRDVTTCCENENETTNLSLVRVRLLKAYENRASSSLTEHPEHKQTPPYHTHRQTDRQRQRLHKQCPMGQNPITQQPLAEIRTGDRDRDRDRQPETDENAGTCLWAHKTLAMQMRITIRKIQVLTEQTQTRTHGHPTPHKTPPRPSHPSSPHIDLLFSDSSHKNTATQENKKTQEDTTTTATTTSPYLTVFPAKNVSSTDVGSQSRLSTSSPLCAIG